MPESLGGKKPYTVLLRIDINKYQLHGVNKDGDTETKL